MKVRSMGAVRCDDNKVPTRRPHKTSQLEACRTSTQCDIISTLYMRRPATRKTKQMFNKDTLQVVRCLEKASRRIGKMSITAAVIIIVRPRTAKPSLCRARDTVRHSSSVK